MIDKVWFDSRKCQKVRLFCSVQTATGAHSAYLVGTEGKKKSRSGAENSLPSKAEVKNAWSHTSALSYAFVVYRLSKHGHNFTFTFTRRECIKGTGRNGRWKKQETGKVWEKEWNRDRDKAAKNETELWVRRMQMEEEKVEYREGRRERKNEVTVGMESEGERKRREERDRTRSESGNFPAGREWPRWSRRHHHEMMHFAEINMEVHVLVCYPA